VAIVGSRQATPYGRKIGVDFARALAAQGLVIVSGLALGADTAPHEGALETGSTIAVLGTGMDAVYPPQNKPLAARIGEHGVLLTEFPLQTPPKPENFPRRNRIIAALAKAVLVIEAKLKSGSLITARLAAELGRDVFAVPGPIYAPTAQGCHRLLKDGALLCTSPDDILFALGIEAQAHGQVHVVADPTLAAIGYTPEPLDTIASRLQSDSATVLGDLLRLEMAGLVLALPGGRYQRVA
jgi:DNA processing protein